MDKNEVNPASDPQESELRTRYELEMEKNEVNPPCNPHESELRTPCKSEMVKKWSQSCLWSSGIRITHPL